MVNKTVLIGGKQRPVNCGRNFLGEIELITGKSFTQLDFMSVRNQQVVAYAALKWGLYKSDGIEPTPDFTIINVGDWIDEKPDVVKEITDVFMDSLPKKESAGENPAN